MPTPPRSPGAGAPRPGAPRPAAPRRPVALVDRAKRILLQPGQEWQVIEKEFTDTATLYKAYIFPLAALGPVCAAIGMAAFGLRMPFVGTFRIPIVDALTQAVIQYALALIMVFVFGKLISFLAPTFGGQRNDVQGLKVAAYASTAYWVGSAFALVPPLAMVGWAVGLYSLYLLYTGLPTVMKASSEKALAYSAVVAVVAIVLSLIVGAIAAAFLPGYSQLGARVT